MPVHVRTTVITLDTIVLAWWKKEETKKNCNNGCSATCRFRYLLAIMEYHIPLFGNKMPEYNRYSS